MSNGAGTAGLGRRFHFLFVASAVSMLGDGVGLTALPLLAAYVSHNPLSVSAVSAAERAPWLLFGLIAGALVDRHDRRRMMWWTDAGRAVLLAALAVAVAGNAVHVWVLVVFALALGSAGTLFDGASPALVPALVPAAEEPLRRANGRLFGAQVVGEQLAGPAIGGLLFTVAASVPFAVDALSFAASAVLLTRVRGDFRADRSGADTAAPSLWHEIGEGVRWLARHRLLRALALLAAAANAALMAGEAVLVLLVTVRLHTSGTGYGLLLATGALGGVLASLGAARLATRLGTAGTMRSALVLLALGSAGTGLAPNVWVCATGFAATAAAAVALNVVTSSLRQALVPDELRGRVISAYRMLALGAGPLGALLGGLVAVWLGVRAPFVLGAAVIGTGVLAAWTTITPDAIARARGAADAVGSSEPG